MAKRQCLECGGELVMAFHLSSGSQLKPDADGLAAANAKWRCGTCGHAFSAEQLRADKRAHPKTAGRLPQ